MGADESSRNRIRTEIDNSFFISAGAGAGKTSLVVDRVMELLKAGKKPSEIVVITFTEAAAAELIERITQRVRNDGLADIRIDDMNISTIHSFCNKLVNMRSFDVGLGLSRRLIENEEEEVLLSDFYDKYISKHSTEPEFSVLRDWYTNNYNKNLKSVFQGLANREDAEYVYDANLLNKSYDDFKDEAFNILTSIKSVLESSKKKLGTNFINYKNDVLTVITDIVDKKDKDEAIKEIKNINNPFKPLPLGGKGITKDVKALNGPENDIIANQVESILGDYHERFEATKAVYGFRAINKIVDDYQNERDDKVITNDSLLYTAARLTRVEEAARFFQTKFKYFFVDEYQDTDDIQTEIIKNLVRDYDKEKELGKPLVIKKGSLVIVGDLKQAIYRFRGADSTIFNKTKDEIKAADIDSSVKIEELSTNFRSNKLIIDWVNEVFEPRFKALSEEYEQMSVSDEREAENSDELSGVFKAAGNNPTAVCSLIKKLVSSQNEIIVKENGKYIKRRIKYSDIMILTRNKPRLPNYAAKLREEDIPVEITGNSDDPTISQALEGTYEIFDKIKRPLSCFAAYVDFLNSPYDNRKRALLVQMLSEKDYITLGDEERDSITKKIYSIRRYIKEMDALGVVGYFQKHIELIMPKSDKLDKQLYSEIQKIFDNLYESIVVQDIQSIDEVSKFALEYIDKNKERLASLAEEGNVVRLMNMHKAKGLQSPIVIIADRNIYEVKSDSTEYKDGRKFYPIISYSYEFKEKMFYDKYRTFALDSSIVDLARKAEKLDDLRISYVAATRAQEILVYMEPSKSNPHILMDGITDGMTDITTKLVGLPQDDDEKATDSSEGETPPVKVYPNSDDYTLYGGGTSLGTKTYVTMNPSGMEHKDGRRTSKKEDRPKGNIFGNVMHRCFQLIVNRLDELKADPSMEDKVIKESIIQAILESRKDMGTTFETDSKKYADFLNKKMKRFVNGSVFKDKICTAEKVYTEYEFSFIFEGEEAKKFIQKLNLENLKKNQPILKYDYDNGKLWVNGISDLVLVNKDGTVNIIDYKSDTIIYANYESVMTTEDGDATAKKEINVEDLEEMSYKDFKAFLLKRYTGQLELYKAAIGRLMKVDEGKISYELYSMYEES